MTSHEALAAWVAADASADTAVAAAAIDPASAEAPAYAEEAAAIARAVTKRRAEFVTGRAQARRALASLGCPPAAIPVRADRDPVWPAGYVGTISHSDALCVAHVGRARVYLGLGLDIEPVSTLERGVAERVATAAERAEIAAAAATDVDPALVCFVAKEAFYKAYFPATRSLLGFEDVRITVDWPAGRVRSVLIAADRPALAGRREAEGSIGVVAGHVCAVFRIARRR